MGLGTGRSWPGLSAGVGLLLAAGLAVPAPGAALRPAAADKIDPRLLSVMLANGDGPVLAWVTFRDKGESGPGDLARRLAEAAAALDPHARARRERARVAPLVDYLDLPVHPPYVESVRALGVVPYGASRWFNGVAVRAPAAALGAIAGLPSVARLGPAETGVPMRDEPAGPPRAAVPARIRSVAALDYGLTSAQLDQIGVPALHDSGYTGVGVRVCVLDNGFNHHADHPALAGADILCTRDFVRGVADPTDTLSALSGLFAHGTNTLGCMAGNAPGRYVGAAPGATYLLGRTEDSGSEKVVEMVYWGMGAEWADSAGADVISSSLGYNLFDNPADNYTYADMNGHTTVVSRAAEIAASKGILVVNSAGNQGYNSAWPWIIAPADVNGDSLVAVGAVDPYGAPAGFSSYGPSADGRVKPDLAALGVGAWCVAAADTGYQSLYGTSFSCPLVAGLAACLMQARPDWSPQLVIRGLRASASRAADPDDRVGYGIPDGAFALRWIPDTAGVPALPPLSLGLRLVGANPITAAAPRTAVDFGAGDGLGAPRLRVYDAQGRLVVRALAFDRNAAAARDGLPLTAVWDGSGDDGRPLRAGLYFITLEAGGRRAAVRVISLR